VALQAVGRDIGPVRVQQPAADIQALGDGGGGRDPFGVVGGDDPAQREREEAGIETAASQMLGDGPDVVVPRLFEDRGPLVGVVQDLAAAAGSDALSSGQAAS
jgi:hypothetical protein